MGFFSQLGSLFCFNLYVHCLILSLDTSVGRLAHLFGYLFVGIRRLLFTLPLGFFLSSDKKTPKQLPVKQDTIPSFDLLTTVLVPQELLATFAAKAPLAHAHLSEHQHIQVLFSTAAPKPAHPSLCRCSEHHTCGGGCREGCGHQFTKGTFSSQ